MAMHYGMIGGFDGDFLTGVFLPTTGCFPPSFVPKPYDEYTLPANFNGTVSLLRNDVTYTLSHNMDPSGLPPPYTPEEDDEDGLYD
jgi:hypothetical protein